MSDQSHDASPITGSDAPRDVPAPSRPPAMRVQLALNVKDLDAAVAFYSRLFGVPVNKRKPGYANFAIDSPPLKLVLFEAPDAEQRLDHLGVEVFRAEDVTAATERLRAADLADLVEDETTCCYAKSDKVWATEPDGLRWEFYRVLDDAESFGEPPRAATGPEPCCG